MRQALPEDMNSNHASTASQFGGVAYARRANELTLYVSIGAELHHLRVDRHDLGLSEISRLTLPAPVQYVVPHPTLGLMYVATSNRSISKADDLHTLTTVAVDERNGALRVVGQSTLPSRPIHLTVTPKGEGVLVVYNLPAGVSWHAIVGDGVAGSPAVQDLPPPLGAYPHQVRVLPSGEAAVVVVRGNHVTAQRGEEPGALEFLSWYGGGLASLATVAPAGGFGFGPRHLDFHPDGRWAALSMERENELQVFAVHARKFAPESAFRTSTLQDAAGPVDGLPHDQLCGAIHFHPRGDRLYVAEAMQYIPTESVHVRTFSFDRSARLMATASILPAFSKRAGRVERVASRITFFNVADDGRLTLARAHDMPNDKLSTFWSHLDGSL